VTNYSQMDGVQALFTLTVAYREELGRVREVIAEVAATDERILSDLPFQVVVDDLGETGVRLPILPTARPEEYLAVRNDLRRQIKARFDAEGIEFAVPRREAHLADAALPPQPADRGSGPRRPGADRSAASTDEQARRANTPVDRGKAMAGDGRSRRHGGSAEQRGA
jgi:small-conductance mechanosensitive channel